MCIFGQGGGDSITLQGLAGDFVMLGNGADFLSARVGTDTVLAGDGADHLTFVCGTTVYAEAGDDYLFCYGSEGSKADAGFGDDYIYLGEGNDTVSPGPGIDEVYTNGGNDTVYVYDACEIAYGSHFDGGAGTDTLYLPMSQAEAASLGVTITGFEFVEMLPTTKQGQSLCSEK